jgi:hypothetical protein
MRYRIVGILIAVGLALEIWTLFRSDAFGFMFFVGAAATLTGIGVILNIYWVTLDLTRSEHVLDDASPRPVTPTGERGENP